MLGNMPATPTAAVGDRILARDRVGAWLLGDIMDERGEGDERSVLVTFDHYSRRFDEWIGVCSDRLARPEDAPEIVAAANAWLEGEFEVDHIVGKRKIKSREQYKVRWQGYSAEYDEWLPAKSIEPSLIVDFETAREAAAVAKPKAAQKKQRRGRATKKARARQPRQPRAPRPPKQPYCLRVLGEDDDAVDRRRLAPVAPWLRGLERQTAAQASHVLKSFAPRVVAKLPDAPPSVYVDLHAAISERASPLAVELDDAVPPISKKTGGQRIADTFVLNEWDLVAKFSGEAVKRNTNDYDLLAAPLEFTFHTTPVPDAKTEIRARGGFIRLEAGSFVNGISVAPTWKFPHGVAPEEETEEQRDERELLEFRSGGTKAGSTQSVGWKRELSRFE